MVTEKSEAEQPLLKKFLSLLLAGALIHHERLMLEMEKEVSDCLEFMWMLIYSIFIIFIFTQFKHPNVLIRDAWILFVSGIVPETELEWVHVQKPFNVLKSFKLFIFFVYFYTFWRYKKVVIIYFSYYIVEVDNLTSLPTILTIIYQWRLLQKDRCLVIFNHEFHHNVMGFHLALGRESESWRPCLGSQPCQRVGYTSHLGDGYFTFPSLLLLWSSLSICRSYQ